MAARVHSAGALVLSMLALGALAGCGGSGSSSSATSGSGAFPPVATSSTSPSGTTTASTTTAAPRAPARAKSKPKPRRSAKAPPAHHTTTAGHTTTAPDSSAGLSATAGYGTYELCAGPCTGSVPESLRRPLQLPAADGGPCPVTLTPNGPVIPSTSTEVGFANSAGSSWAAARVIWEAAARYQGPILIRGRQIGGAGSIGFGEGQVPYDELQLLSAGQGAPRVANGGRAWRTYSRVQTSGCYAYQVDGTDFSEVIVFRAVV